jgi:putative acetyltransferase
MNIRRDDPNAPHVAPLLAFHLSELRAVMSGEFAFARRARPVGTGRNVLDGVDRRRAGRIRGAEEARRRPCRGEIDARRSRVRRSRRRPRHDAAVALYRNTGFVDCPPFADYRASPHNRFMTLAL